MRVSNIPLNKSIIQGTWNLSSFVMNALQNLVAWLVLKFVPYCKRYCSLNHFYIHLHLKYFHHSRVWSRSEPVPFGTRLIPFCLSKSKLAYFLLGFCWTGFRSDLVGLENKNDGNTENTCVLDRNAKFDHKTRFGLITSNSRSYQSSRHTM